MNFKTAKAGFAKCPVSKTYFLIESFQNENESMYWKMLDINDGQFALLSMKLVPRERSSWSKRIETISSRLI